jgi:hypothetical protein
MKILYLPKKVYYIDLINYPIDINKFQFLYKNVYNDVFINGICTNNDLISWVELREEFSKINDYLNKK